MLINGVDTDKLTFVSRPELVRPVIPGRTLQLDGDFVAYFVSAANDVSLEDMYKNAETIIERLKQAAGAEYVNVHLTPKGSTKGGRADIALLKEYQANRKGKPKPVHLDAVREHIAQSGRGIMWHDAEADDGMSMYQNACIDAGQTGLSVICSKDKDLRIVQGLHLDWDTLDLFEVDFFGSLELVKKKTTKLLGTGFKFFCAQMLMGDPADNISGIPGLVVNGEVKKCGPVSAFNLLNSAKTPQQALHRVVTAYQQYGRAQGFQTYKGTNITSEDAFLSEAKLLWMRRHNDPEDVLELFQEIKDLSDLFDQDCED